MTTKNEEPKCGLCGGDAFDFREGETFRWMAVICSDCDMMLELRKEHSGKFAHAQPNLTHGIKQYCTHTAAIAKNLLARDGK